MLIDDGMYPLSDAFFEQLGDFMLRTGNTAGMALVAEVERLRAEKRKLAEMASELLPYGAITGHVCHCSVCLELRGAREAGSG